MGSMSDMEPCLDMLITDANIWLQSIAVCPNPRVSYVALITLDDPHARLPVSL